MTDRGAGGKGEPDHSRPLRLLALDGDDLAVISAHLQDALVRPSEIAYLPSGRRFALVADRFDWCAAETGRTERLRAGLHFEGVTKASYQGMARDAQAVLSLLSISFEENDPPAGLVRLTFSGGAAIRLAVECLEVQMRDMGPRWPVRHKPGHDVQKDGAEN